MSFSFVLLGKIDSPIRKLVLGYNAKIYSGSQWMIEDELEIYNAVAIPECDKLFFYERSNFSCLSQENPNRRVFNGTIKEVDKNLHDLCLIGARRVASEIPSIFRTRFSHDHPSTLALTLASQHNLPILDITPYAEQRPEQKHLNFLLNDPATRERVKKAVEDIK